MSDYFKERNHSNNERLKKELQNMPDFVTDFFIGISDSTTPLTRLGYVQDLKVFFDFLIKNVNNFFDKNKVSDLNINSLNEIKSNHIEQFMHYLNSYQFNGKTYTNGKKTKARKLSTIRKLLDYFFQKDLLDSNVAMKVKLPKIPDNEIVRLEINEVTNLLNNTESGLTLSKMQKNFHKHTSKRDLAILTLLLGTGIRISECVGLNVDDFDFENQAFNVTRKGGHRVILYFSDEIEKVLKDYLKYRNNMNGLDDKEKAFFVSLQKRRINVRTVEKMVKKYSSLTTPLKKITPHKLRSTFGTNLYRETNDIYVVADVLGHKDVNTTKKHYAAIDSDIKRMAANKVKLRKD